MRKKLIFWQETVYILKVVKGSYPNGYINKELINYERIISLIMKEYL